MLATARSVIVDEIHAVASTKRGSHLAVSLETLDTLCGRKLQRIGLSATQKPIEAVARFLIGARRRRRRQPAMKITPTRLSSSRPRAGIAVVALKAVMSGDALGAGQQDTN